MYEKEGTFVVNSTILDISAVKVTLNLSEICNDLLKSEQNNSSTMLDLPLRLCTDTSTSKNASNIIIGSSCKSDDSLDGYDK